MSANHPYPKHVTEAVAEALMKSSEGRDAFGAGGDWDAAGYTIKQEFLDHAETALQALWDASRVDNQDHLEQVGPDVIMVSAYGYEADYFSLSGLDGDEAEGYFPARVIYWGDRDE